MNREIELHDSRIEAVVREGDDLIALFTHAYVHESMGKPGIDAGMGFSQRASLRIANAQLLDVVAKWPVTIADGELTLGERTFSNMFPIHIDFKGSSVLSLVVYDEDSVFTRLRIAGSGVQVHVHGTATQIEGFLGSA